MMLGLALVAAEPVELTGSNGRTVSFAGVKAARPEGLVLRQSADGAEMTVPWNRFDLEALRAQPEIFAAMERASRGEVVPLRLGFYANMMDLEGYQAFLREELGKTARYPVPRLSEFFEHKDDDQSFLSTSKSQDSNAAKRSKRFVKSYTELIEEFFRLPESDIAKETITWDYGDGDCYVIVKEAYPRSAKNVELSGLTVLAYFADEDLHSHNRAAKYFNYHAPELGPILKSLRRCRDVADSKLDAPDATCSRVSYQLNELIEHFESFQESISLSADLSGDIQSFARETGINLRASHR